MLPSSTESYQSYIESYQYYIEYDECYTKSDQSRKSFLNLTTSYRIVSNPSNLTRSCQILAILHSFTKSNQSYIESYQWYIEYDESYTKSDQSRKSFLNLTISIKSYEILPNVFQPYKILSNLSHITLYYKVLLISHRILPMLHRIWRILHQIWPISPKLAKSYNIHQIVSNPSKPFQPYKILSNLSHIPLYYKVVLISHPILPMLHRIWRMLHQIWPISPKLAKSYNIISNRIKSFQPYKILSNLSHITQF